MRLVGAALKTLSRRVSGLRKRTAGIRIASPRPVFGATVPTDCGPQ